MAGTEPDSQIKSYTTAENSYETMGRRAVSRADHEARLAALPQIQQSWERDMDYRPEELGDPDSEPPADATPKTGWLLVSHPDGTEWTAEDGSQLHKKALRASHLTIQPLYTRPDAGEVEQWKSQAAYNQETALRWQKDNAALRSQLAEQGALLRELRRQFECANFVNLGKLINAALSATAEPAGPARCMNCDRATVEQCDDAGCGFLGAGNGGPTCKCDMRTKLVGDGCAVCNPELASDLAEPAAVSQKSEGV